MRSGVLRRHVDSQVSPVAALLCIARPWPLCFALRKPLSSQRILFDSHRGIVVSGVAGVLSFDLSIRGVIHFCLFYLWTKHSFS